MFRSAIGAAVIALVAWGPAAADSPVKIAEISGRLFDVGAAQQDPVLVLAAAKLRRSLELEKVARAPDGGGAEDAEDMSSWQAMAALAREFAVGDDAMLGLIEDFEAEKQKGVTTGQVYSISKIRVGGNDTYAGVQYTGGEYAEVYVEGKSNTDLNLRILDHKNRLVCSDTDVSKIAYCGWRPRQTASFSIVVENKGSRATSYSLITN